MTQLFGFAQSLSRELVERNLDILDPSHFTAFRVQDDASSIILDSRKI